MAQWVADQLSNIMLIEDSTLLRNVLSLLLHWHSVQSAWAVSISEIEKDHLGWVDSIQWSLNEISNLQLAVLNSHGVSSNGQKVRISHFFSEATCTTKEHHGSYNHFCAHFYKQG